MSATSPNRQPYKYANNVTVKTLLEARKDAEKVPGETTKPIVLKKTPEATTSTTTMVFHPTSSGIKTLKIPSKAALDSAVQAVVTEIPTSLPTANIKVPAPAAMPAIQPRYNVTKTIQSMKGPISTAPRVEPMSLSSPNVSRGHATLLTSPAQGHITLTSQGQTTLPTSPVQGHLTLTSPAQGQITLPSSPAQGQTTLHVSPAAQGQTTQFTGQVQTSNASQSLLTQLQAGNNQIMLTALNKAGGIGNVVLAAPQHQEKKNMTLKVLPQGLQQAQQGVMQGYLTPQGLIIPQAALQQQTLQQASTQLLTQGALTNQTLLQGALGNLPLQVGFGAGNMAAVLSGNQLNVSQIGTNSGNMSMQNTPKMFPNNVRVLQNSVSTLANIVSTQNSTVSTERKAVGQIDRPSAVIAGLNRAVGTNPVSSLINATPMLSTTLVSSTGAKPSVGTDKFASAVMDTPKVRLQTLGGGASTLLNLGGISKLQGQSPGLLMPGLIPGMNLVNAGGQFKLQDGSNNVTLLGNNSINLSAIVTSTTSSVVTKPSLASSGNTLGHIYPMVTLAGSGLTTAASSGAAIVPPSPTINPVPQSPVQLAPPLLGQLTSPMANMGNIATMLGQMASPLSKPGIINQQTGVGGNIQLLAQPPGMKLATGTSGQILRLPNIPNTSSSLIGQQLSMSVSRESDTWSAAS